MPNSQAFNTSTLSRRSFVTAALSFIALPSPKKSTSLLSNVTSPRFWFGDRVVDHYWGEDPHDMTREIEVVYRGTVVGLAWSKGYRYSVLTPFQWHYSVQWDEEPDELAERCCYIEDDLKPESWFNLVTSKKRA